MKIYYLSVTSFSDVDFGILKLLPENHVVKYGVIIQKNNANFTVDEIADYCNYNNIDFQPFIFSHQQKDPRSFVIFYKIINDILLFKPDVIYIPTFDHIFFSLLSLRLNKEKTIIALHDVEFHSNAAYSRFIKIARWVTMVKFFHFQVFSEFQKQLFQKKYPLKSVTMVPLPLKDYGRSAINNSRIEKIRILFFGNILPYKNLPLLLEAVDILSENFADINLELIIAGRCDNWDEEYRPLIKNKQIVKTFIGFIDNCEVAKLFNSVHYLILPYKDATQSGPLKIAFNYNIPVIASDLVSFREEIANNVNGYLFKSGDVSDLEKTLRYVICNHERNYSDMKVAQKKFINSKYSFDTTRKIFLEMLNQIM